MKTKNPCDPNCKNRSSGCHSTCNLYLEYRKELDMYNEKRAKYKQQENDYYEFKYRKLK